MKIAILFLLLLFSIPVFAQSATVIAEKANLRGTPSDSGKVVAKVSHGLGVEVFRQNGTWFLVQTAEYVGWLHGNVIRLDDPVLDTTVPVDEIVSPAPARLVSQPAEPKQKNSPVVIASPAPRSSTSRTYFRGPRGGCYYINSSGKKTYVDHSFCS